MMRANPPRVFQIRSWQSLWLALWPRDGGLPGAQRARAARAAAIPGTAARLGTIRSEAFSQEHWL